MLSLEEKIGQKLMVGFQGLEPPDYLLRWLEAGKVGGIILFARNVESPTQLARLTTKIQSAARYPLLIAIDQEGGSVSRLRGNFTESPGAMALGASHSPELAEKVAHMMGVELHSLGINWNFAPSLDMAHDRSNPSIGTRSLGSDPVWVGRMGAAQIRGFQSAGVAATAKHFPGLGSSDVDTHIDIAEIDAAVDELWEADIAPFRAAIQADVSSIMVTHVRFRALDSIYPATLSRAVVTDLLRNRLGYTGISITDCLEMRAISGHFTPAETAIRTVLAGQDIALFSHTREVQEAAYDALVRAATEGDLPLDEIDASVARIMAFKQQFATPVAVQPEIVKSEAHLAIANEAARAGVVLFRADSNVFPLRKEVASRTAVIEFVPHQESEAVDPGAFNSLAKLLKIRLPEIETLLLDASAPDDEVLARARIVAREFDCIVLVTRSADLIAEQFEFAREFLWLAHRVVLVCLRNPYDVEVLAGANTVLCTFGDTEPSVQAAADAVMGDYVPHAKLPVPIQLAVADIPR
ncbi:MAG: beta-N-acetylhexosaminidase [Anaerolineae bacterium]|nr:beta-N-acetylhexosaminidase [Anaerolineae bacterium]